MKRLTIKTQTGLHNFDFPETIDEVSAKYLDDVTSNVNLANDYVLVAIVYRQNLNALVTINKNMKNNTTMAVPMFIKAGTSSDTFINNLSVGDKLVVSGSDLSMGYHVSCPANTLSGTKFAAMLQDEDVRKNNLDTLKKLFGYDVYLVEFKIIPACNIHGVVGDYTTNVVDAYHSVETVPGN